MEAMSTMQHCIDELHVRQWMMTDRLKLNDDKTEYLLIGTRQATVGYCCISPPFTHPLLMGRSFIKGTRQIGL